jgi:hypothetical protein
MYAALMTSHSNGAEMVEYLLAGCGGLGGLAGWAAVGPPASLDCARAPD